MRTLFLLASLLLITPVSVIASETDSQSALPQTGSVMTGTQAEEPVDLDAIISDKQGGENREDDATGSRLGTARAGRASPYKFSLFGDFKVNLALNPVMDKDWTFDFLKEHTELFLTVNTSSGLGATADIVHIADYLEFYFSLSTVLPVLEGMPVLGESEVRLGKILVPFGEYKFHHLYGGSVGISRNLAAVLWTDLGISWNAKLLPGLGMVLYALNGLKYNADNFFLESGGDSDKNNAKSVGTKFRYDFPFGFLSTSVLYDRFGVKNDFEGDAWLFGLDGGVRLGIFDWTAAGIYARGTSEAFTVKKWGWYNQFSVKLAPPVGVRLRFGQVDTNTAVENETDLSSATLSLLLDTGIFELDLSYSITQVSQRFLAGNLDDGMQDINLTFYFML